MPKGSQRIGLKEGWIWFKAGFARYRRNPLLLLFWVMSYWTLLGLSGLVPVLGDLLAAAVAPVLLVGVMAGCRALDAESMPNFMCFFSGFGAGLQALMALGVIHFLLTMGVLGLTALVGGGTLLQTMVQTAASTTDKAQADFDQDTWLAIGMAFVVYIPVMLAFAYAPLLVAWRGFGLGKALFFSLVGSWRAWRGLLGFLLCVIGLGILLPAVVMSLLMALGLSDAIVTASVMVPVLAVLAPTIVSALYSSYLDILPLPEGATVAQSV